MTMKRYAGLALLHPKAISSFINLNHHLTASYEAGKTKTLFKVFETFRDAERQQHVFATKASKALPWQSPHNYGLAVDFVGWKSGKWSWDPSLDWDFLGHAANMNGLLRPISWDLAHVEHPLWNRLRQIIL